MNRFLHNADEISGQDSECTTYAEYTMELTEVMRSMQQVEVGSEQKTVDVREIPIPFQASKGNQKEYCNLYKQTKGYKAG
jgi:prolyl-tRNA synthetase